MVDVGESVRVCVRARTCVCCVCVLCARLDEKGAGTARRVDLRVTCIPH